MLRIFSLQFTLLLLLSYIGCNSTKQKVDGSSNHTTNDIPDSHTSENALDWEGSYQGVLPCADCEGIKTTIKLNRDLSYNIKDEYLGKKDGVFESQGTFKWNDGGQKIILSDSDRNNYFVGENRLIQLDASGNKITGDLANLYVLNKMNTPEITLKDTKWQLVEIMGKKQTNSEAFISFATEDNRVFGYNSCNNFNGGYELKDGNRISLSKIAMTMRACMDENVETQFMDVLQTIDNYSFHGNTLTLNKARMAPLAVFEAVE